MRRDAGQRIAIVDGRIVSLNRGRVQLWTIVRPATWEALRAATVLFVDPARILYEDFLPQYDWVRRQMARRIPRYAGHYPWWAWAYPKPDLRSTAFHRGPPGAPLIRLGLAVPVAEALFMDYDRWTIPLNNGYIGLDRDDDDAWDTLPTQERTSEALERSWERLLDHSLTLDPEYYGVTDTVQAVFETLRLEDVTEVRHFRSRASARQEWHPALLPPSQ